MKTSFYMILLLNGAFFKFRRNFKKYNKSGDSISTFLNWYSPCRWLEYAFDWGNTPEGRKYWQKIDNQMIEYRNSL